MASKTLNWRKIIMMMKWFHENTQQNLSPLLIDMCELDTTQESGQKSPK